MGLKVGSLTGTSILGAKATEKSHRHDIAKLNDGTLDGLVVTDKMGATGYNLVAANHIIFLGSLYSITMERQAIGISLFLSLLTTLGRIARRLQRRVPKAYIIASPSFPGDNAALEMKRQRGEEDEDMIRRISETELQMLSAQFSDVHVRDDGNLEYDLTGVV
jgi:hypothetical protein